MARRYPALSTLRPDYAVPLLTWLTEELDMRLKDMRNVRTCQLVHGALFLLIWFCIGGGC